jgi:hypothetical protein
LFDTNGGDVNVLAVNGGTSLRGVVEMPDFEHLVGAVCDLAKVLLLVTNYSALVDTEVPAEVWRVFVGPHTAVPTH